MLSAAFAAVLGSDRESFNARFTQARRARPALGDGERFAAFLRDAVDPVVDAVPGSDAAAVGEVAYALALELVGARLDGPALVEGWRRVLPAAAPAVAANPWRVLAAVSNALCTLETTPGARPAEWTETMTWLAPLVGGDVEKFRRLGQVAAWRAGLAHFRESALAVADTLPELLAAAGVGAEAAPWAETRARLAADPWFLPGRPDAAPLHLAAGAGGFRGFGGPFPEPPRVAAGAEGTGGFLVLGGGECRWLTADASGATFHRADPADFTRAQNCPPPLGLEVNGSRVAWHGRHVEVPVPGDLTSAAADGRTLALTGSLTHLVLLVPLSILRP